MAESPGSFGAAGAGENGSPPRFPRWVRGPTPARELLLGVEDVRGHRTCPFRLGDRTSEPSRHAVSGPAEAKAPGTGVRNKRPGRPARTGSFPNTQREGSGSRAESAG